MSSLFFIGLFYTLATAAYSLLNRRSTALRQAEAAPATGLPVAFMYCIGVVMSIGMFAIIAFNLYRALFVHGAIDTLVVLRESEDERDFSADAERAEQLRGEKK